MSQVDLRHIRTRMRRGTSQAVPTGGPTYKPFHPYARIAPDALSRAETRRETARRKAKRQGPLPTPPPSHPRASSHDKDASDTNAKPIKDTVAEEPTPPMSPTKRFLSSSAGALVGFFNKITRGALGENTASNTADTNAPQHERREGDNLKVTGRKRGREEDEKGSEDDHDRDKSEDVAALRPDFFRVRKRRREVDLEREQPTPLAAEPTADVDLEGDIGDVQEAPAPSGSGASDTNEATDDMQDPPRTESMKGSIPGTDDQADGEGERDGDGDDDDREVSCGATSSEGGEDGEEAFSNVNIRTTDDQATEEFDPAVGDSTRVGPGEGEEQEDEGDSGSDSRSDIGSEDDGGMNDDGMPGNTFQLMDVE
ncbi:hypothetical protein M404DRAFT_29413, partial [Pisolithus tinctorius Marx 270]